MRKAPFQKKKKKKKLPNQTGRSTTNGAPNKSENKIKLQARGPSSLQVETKRKWNNDNYPT